MKMKKIFFIYFLLVVSIELYSLTEGSFIPVSYIENNFTIRYTEQEKTVDYCSISLFYRFREYDIGYLCVDGCMPFLIIKKEMKENKLNIEGFYLDSEFQSNINDYLNVVHDNYHYSITIIDDDEIIFDDFGYSKDTHFYRLSGPAKIPVKNAVINDSRVRLRVKPNLTCDTWALLDKGLPVKIKDKSKEKFEIDGESHYWYKVDNPNYPDGWVYGKYLDIEECTEEN